MKKLTLLGKVLLPIWLLLSMSAHADDSCAQGCHIIKPYEDGISNANLLSSKHIANGITCIDCHEQDDETRKMEAEAYANGEYDDPMYTREFENDFCLRCHEDYEVLAEKTKHLEEEWGINPHESHLDPECYQCHKSHQSSTVVCAECHMGEWDKRMPEGWELK
ncbi:hypothetical protein GCM10009347_00060 [Shewanella algicola]|uniref:Cytochrome c3 family protein n=1 Tax=Shewanella algicola TaxID=640633 RepID=A0A9X1Z562_9GAMM|nr:cytochrome c3 family protein [Shewanella algicola]MCL1103889.1 cytochrome c3 family protein [Shewanella algicola]GGP36329.1 hypothetical protein GCM10009347_00060 [Shewanella algicola]